jgi:replicative DNA helicase
MTTHSKLSMYGPSFQIKVLGALLTQRKFLINVSDALDSEYFENTSHKWIIDKLLKYFQQYHTNPTIDYLSSEVKKLENDILRLALTEALRDAFREADSKDLEWVENEFTDFCRNQQVKKAIMTSVDLLNMGDFDGIRSLINNALKSGQDRNIGLDYKKDIEARYRIDSRNAIPFPWKTFNDLTQGGYGAGDLVLIFGNPKGGKSWAVVAMGAYAATLGYNVAHYSLELGEDYTGKRYDAVLTGIPVDKLDLHKDRVQEVMDKVKGRVVIKAYPPKKASFDTIESHLQQLELQEDFKPDLVIIDYLDYMKTRARNDRKQEIDDVYVTAKSFAREKGIPVISPSQANRGAAKNDIIEGDNAAGSYEKIMIGDILISLARRRKDRKNGTGRWHVMGNRYGADGLTFLSKIDTSCGRIEISSTPLDEDDDEQPIKKSNKFDEFDNDEKDELRQKFFKTSLSNES